jgi:hypothetical protein
LDEGYDIVFEQMAPDVTKMRGLKHTIKLDKIEGNWKIIEDLYHDELWNYIRGSGKTKDEILSDIDVKLKTQNKQIENRLTSNSYTLSSPTQTINQYDRLGAVIYADDWALSRNPAFGDFSNDGGDCTNFVSQAMNVGGKAPMVLPVNGQVPGIGTNGWYYWDWYHRASAWNLVDHLYKYLVTENFNYKEGLVGKVSDYEHMEIGDIVQIKNYDAQGNLIWAHSMIVAGFLDPYVTPYPMVVDAHSTDYYHLPLGYYSWVEIRFIHITGIKKPVAYVPFLNQNNSTSLMSTTTSMSSTNSLQIMYPAPSILRLNSSPNSLAYPAP